MIHLSNMIAYIFSIYFAYFQRYWIIPRMSQNELKLHVIQWFWKCSGNANKFLENIHWAVTSEKANQLLLNFCQAKLCAIYFRSISDAIHALLEL